jgi:hypothetical protein
VDARDAVDEPAPLFKGFAMTPPACPSSDEDFQVCNAVCVHSKQFGVRAKTEFSPDVCSPHFADVLLKQIFMSI